MTDKQTQAHHTESNMEKDPADWVTGDEPMTGAQRSYLKTLSEEAHAPFDATLSKAEASRRIDELQARTGRGAARGHTQPSPDADKSVLQSIGEAASASVLGEAQDDARDPTGSAGKR